MYGDLDALNASWGTEFPVDYVSWDEVEPPSGVGFRAGGYPCWIDWQRFCEDNLAGLVAGVVEIVHANDPQNRPATLNLTPMDVTGGAIERHINLEKVARSVDVTGFSHYTYTESDPCTMAAKLDRARSAGRSDDVWIIETGSGPVYWVHGNLPGHTQVKERLLRYWQSIGHNVSAIFYWLYRTRFTDSQAGEFGLTGWDGSPTKRSLETGELSKFMQKQAELFKNLKVASKAAILVSQSSLRLGSAEGYEGEGKLQKSYWQRSWMGAYKLLWDLRIPVDFISADEGLAEKIGTYPVVLVPFHPNICAKAAAVIKAYIRDGGSLYRQSIRITDRIGA